MSTSDFTIFDPHNPKLKEAYVSNNFKAFIEENFVAVHNQRQYHFR